MKKYDAIVIGSGIGGLSAALLMQANGKNVLMIEKLKAPGGRLSSVEKDGFKMDLGVHVISRGAKGPIGQILEQTGCGMPLDFTTVRPVTSFRGEVFKFPQELYKFVPEDAFKAFLDFMAFVRSTSEEESHKYDDVNLDEFLYNYTDNLIVHQAVSIIDAVYLGIPAFVSSTGEFIRCLDWEAGAHASGYPDGGCIAIAAEFLKGFKDKGGEALFGTPVEKIIVEDGKAVGVIAGGEEYRADMIVSNAGIKQTVLKFVEPGVFDDDYIQYVEGLTPAWSAIIFRIAMDQPVTDLKMFSQFEDKPMPEVAQSLLDGTYEGGMGVFFVVPSNFSDKICSPDKQLLMATTCVPTGTPETMYEPLRKHMFEAINTIVPGFEEHIMWVDATTPKDLEAMLGESGASIGLGQMPGQTGADRPSVKTPLEGLYIVGGEAGGSGVGIELCANSAIEFFEKYVK